VAVMSTAVAGVCLYWRGRLAAAASEAIAQRLREHLYRHLHRLEPRFYDTADTGDIVQRASSDVETVRVFLSGDVIEIGRAVMLVVCVTPILFVMDARLAALALCLLPVLAVGAFLFFSRVKSVFQVTDEAEAAMTTTLQENLTGIRVVRAFARQAHEIERFDRRNAAFRDQNQRLIRLMSVYWSSSDLVAITQTGLVLFAGAAFIREGSLTVGTLFAFLTCVSIVLWPVRQLGRVLTDSGKAVISIGRINEILNEPAESDEPSPAIPRAAGSIAFEGLTFGYAADRPILREITLHIAAGETVAFVGPPGAGKSTLIRVLLRLYPYDTGTVRLDGHELRTLNRHWLRRQIGVVLQDPFLYSRSIRDNLTVGASGSDIDPDQLADACRDAAIATHIERLPDGYATAVGERGVTLSGGQRQRLALARALLKDPPVLVLDDALSAVDTGTEAHIQAALQRRRGRHTTLIIAHRLSSVLHADRIVVMDAGRIVAIGNHATLSEIEGPYRRLCAIQGSLDAAIQADVDGLDAEARTPRSGDAGSAGSASSADSTAPHAPGTRATV
ncbi:MAG: ABC transporter ATP-binding protein, partial [Gammaproteobacteria bacterium]